jgi:outer membrane receptor for ferrienterochelin and colicins
MFRRAMLVIALLATGGRLFAQAPAARSGKVVDAATRMPIVGAIVETVAPPSLRTRTDQQGEWRLAADSGVRLRVRFLGYAPLEFDAGTALVELTPSALPLEDMVVTASRREQQLTEAVPDISVISQADIRRSGASDVGAVLVQTSGVQPEGGVPAGAGIYLEGLGSQRVLILVDGQPVVGRLNGNFDLSRLASAGVERIEIVRGPQSTLYGSDAMGGVINIITRPPTDGLSLSLMALGGTQDRRELSGAMSGTTGALGLSINADARKESLAPGLPGDNGTYAQRWQVAPKARWAFGGSTLEGSALLLRENQRYLTGQLYHFSDNTQSGAQLNWNWQSGGRRFAPTLSFSRFDHLSRAGTGAVPVSDSGQRDVQQLAQGELVGSLPIPSGVADLGVQLRYESIEADRVQGGQRSLNSIETWAQGTWDLGRLSVTPGVRLSAHEQWGSAMTPRLAALLHLSPTVALRASAGAGYRVPDFKELYLDFVNTAAGYAVVGNPNLVPEHSRNVSLGVELARGPLSARVSSFYNRFTDFIDFGPPDAGNTYTYVNIGQGMTRGLEAVVVWNRGTTRFEEGIAFLDAQDQTSHLPLLGRAANAAHFSVAGTIRGANLSATFLYTGRAPLALNDSSTAVATWRSAYSQLNLHATAPVRAGASVVLGVDNVFDQQIAQGWPGFTGRRIYGGVSWGGGAVEQSQ